jgi:hypothetical protein
MAGYQIAHGERRSIQVWRARPELNIQINLGYCRLKPITGAELRSVLEARACRI